MHNEMPILQNLLFAWVAFFHVRIYFNVNIQFQVTIKIYGTRFSVDIVISCFIPCLYICLQNMEKRTRFLSKQEHTATCSSSSKPIFSIRKLALLTLGPSLYPVSFCPSLYKTSNLLS